MRVLVTGATGFVGSHLVDHLVQRGDSVRALVLPGEAAAAARLRARGVEVHPGDLADGRDPGPAVAGMDVVLHCAGLVRLTASRDAMWKVNVEATARLAAASARADVSRFVYLSSVAVYGHASPPIAEDAPKQPVSAYGESKWAAEQALWRCHAERRLPVTVLRPCVIYGPRDDKISPVLLRMCRARFLPLPSGGRRALDLVYVSDVADAALAAATSPKAVGRAYNVTDGERHSYRDVLTAGGRVSGRPPAILPIPGRALLLAVGAAQLILRLMRRPGEWAGHAARLRGLDLDLHFAIDAARRDLDYAPRVGLAEGLSRTFAWCMQQGSGDTVAPR